MATKVMKAGINIVQHLLVEGEMEEVGRVVLEKVGNLHDIDKKLISIRTLAK